MSRSPAPRQAGAIHRPGRDAGGGAPRPLTRIRAAGLQLGGLWSVALLTLLCSAFGEAVETRAQTRAPESLAGKAIETQTARLPTQQSSSERPEGRGLAHRTTLGSPPNEKNDAERGGEKPDPFGMAASARPVFTALPPADRSWSNAAGPLENSPRVKHARAPPRAF